MEEKKPLKIKFKTAVILIIIAVILLGVCGANIYASANEYGNVFSLIKHLITGEKSEISDKDISTNEEEKNTVDNISKAELKKYLSIIAGFEENFDVNDEDSRISFAIRINSILNRQILDKGLYKATEINNILKSIGYGEILTANFKGEYFREKTVKGEKYLEMIYEPDTVNMETIIGEIKDITYSSNIYTANFKYLNTSPKTNINYFDHEAEAKEATIYFKLNDDKTYSTFKVVKYVKGAEAINNKDTHIENDELIGNWEVSFAQENGKDISLMDIYGSGLSGTMNFETNGKYTEFIGVYSSENEDDLQGNYINNKSTIDLIANSGKKSVLTIKNINDEKYIEKQIGTTNRYVYFRKTSSNNFSEKTNLNNIATQLTPSGFAGSSLLRVDLYSNKEVYLITFDGNGYKENNIITKELIARNVDSISKSEDGNIYIKGGIQVKDDLGWIHFETIDNVSDDEIENEIRNVMGAYIELLGARISDVTAPLYKLDLKYKESNQDAKKIGYNKTNILYSKFKEEMLKYMTEKCFNTEMNADNVYIEEDGFLCHSGGAASGHDYKLKEITKISDKVYQAEVLATLEEDTRIIYFEIGVEKQNGKYVVDYSRQIYN